MKNNHPCPGVISQNALRHSLLNQQGYKKTTAIRRMSPNLQNSIQPRCTTEGQGGRKICTNIQHTFAYIYTNINNLCSIANVQFLAYSKWLMNVCYARTLDSVCLQNVQTYWQTILSQELKLNISLISIIIGLNQSKYIYISKCK